MTDFAKVEYPQSGEDISRLVSGADHIEIAGSQSKGKLAAGRDGMVLVNLCRYTGILEYEPQEYVISARAGTPLRTLSAELAEHNQYLPFDPPCSSAGATLGGVVATGWSGPGCLRHGRLRDFIIGVDIVSGAGRWIRGGGRVVKNAAGFDLPKLMVGSLGCFGIIGNVVLKVFPSPVASMTIVGNFEGFEPGREGLIRILRSGMVLDGCVLEPGGRLSVRIAGMQSSLEHRSGTIMKLLGTGTEILTGDDDKILWETFRDSGPGFETPARCKIPIRPSEILHWQEYLGGKNYRYFYDQAGAVLVIDAGENTSMSEIETLLVKTGNSALVVGKTGGPRLLGELRDLVFIERIRQGLDPDAKFPGIKDRAR